MTIAHRINRLIATMAVIATLLVTLFVGQREFNFQRDAILLAISSLVGSRPQLQLIVYFRESDEIQRTLVEAMALSPAIRRAVLYDSQGEVIGSRAAPWAGETPPPDLVRLREGLSPLERGLVRSDGGRIPASLQVLQFVTLGEKNTSLVLPIVSVVNPQGSDIGREDFAAALAYPQAVTSHYVLGYLEVALSSTMIWSLTLPAIAMSAGLGGLIVFLFWLIARTITRRITAPLNRLAKVADDIAAGRQTQPIPVQGSGEVRDIAEVLNGIIAGLHQYTKRMDADRRILSLKVDERTQQLNETHSALREAARDVSEARDRARQLLYFDSLTSLPNRRLFQEQLTLLLRLARRSQDRVGLLLIDIDDFKRINKTLGSDAGDRVLREISARLTDSVRDSDVLHRRSERDSSVMDLSRMGGDEFTVVLNRVEGPDAARLVAERLASALLQPVMLDGEELVITCSIGISLFPDHADTVESMMKTASTAMLAAKKRGRSQAVLYDSTMEADHRERLKLETELRKAIELDQLLLHYQPQVHAETGEVCGVEALVRWNHPVHGLVPPFKWIPIAEDLGLIREVGSWVLHQACADLVALREEGLQLGKVSVNVSALQLNESLHGEIVTALQDSGLPPESLELELTEGALVTDQESTLDLLQRITQLGVRLSVDDFGTGYSSLSYLSRLPLDVLKVDRSFVIGLADGGANVELVRAIIAMAHSLELDIVVEGVENTGELDFFSKQRAHVVQGFLFSKPVPVEELRPLLAPRYFASMLAGLHRADTGGPTAFEPA
jgi:diguanylate cyclase (GGDEF)-like protein